MRRQRLTERKLRRMIRKNLQEQHGDFEADQQKTIDSFVDEFGEDAREEIEETISFFVPLSFRSGDGSFEVDGNEYVFYYDESDAYNDAVEQTLDSVKETQSYYLDLPWIYDFLDEDATKEFLDDIYEESFSIYAEEIADESSREFPSRLAEEMVDMGVVGEDEARDPDFDHLAFIDEFITRLVTDMVPDAREGLENLKSDFGSEMVEVLIKKHNLIDWKEVADYIVREDGWSSVLAGYDGTYDSLPDGTVYFRTS